MSNIDWKNTFAAKFRTTTKSLRAIRDIDFVDIDLLVGLESQKEALLQNTQNFMYNSTSNHALLWGERGCGKSSLAKAVFTKFYGENLRVIEILKDDLIYIADILDDIRDLEYKFIIFCDDLSFESGDDSYKHLKPLLDGSIEKSPKNVLLYATSNRRHLVAEYIKDNQNAEISSDEIHYKDAVEERISLSDRFGLTLSFYQGNFDSYLKIVDSYFAGFDGDRARLHEEAKKFAMLRAASRSGRTAKQFYLAYYNIFN